MARVNGVIYNVSGKNFRLRGSPYVYVYMSASDKFADMLARSEGRTAFVTIKKILDPIVIVQHVQIDKYKSRIKSNTRKTKALNENQRNLQESRSHKRLCKKTGVEIF